MDPDPYDVFAVELSSFQLHYTDSMSAESAAVLNVAEDHLDWYSSMAGVRRRQGPHLRAGAAGLRLQRRRPRDRAAGPRGRRGRGRPGDRLHPRHPRRRDARRGRGHPGRPRVHRGARVQRRRAVHHRRPRLARHRTSSPNALAAAALARAHGVSQAAVRDGLRAFRPDGHRIATVAEADGVTWVDDSKATNPHAAQSSLQGYDPVVWVAGGLAKGARFDDLVTTVRDRLRGVVLLGRDRARDRGRPFATRPRCTRHRRRRRRDWHRTWRHGARRRGGCPARTARRHGAAGPRLRLHGHVRELRRTRRRLRGGRPAPDGPHGLTGERRRDDHHRRPPPYRQPAAPRRPGPPAPASCSWYAALRSALDRPLTSYYLLLGASALLLTIGLIMVLSASSVYSFEHHDGDSYAVVKRQLMWVVLGIPCAWIASRLPYGAIRQISWLGILVAVVLLALTQTGLGTTVNGNTNWLAVGPLQIQPSEIAKLAIVLWAAHVYAQKDRRLGRLHQIMMPVVPVILAITLLVIVGRDLGTALVLFAILLAMLWVVGAPARLFTFSMSIIGVVGALPRVDRPRAARAADQLRRPVQGLPRRRLAARPRPVRPVVRRLVRPGDRRQPAEVGRPARGAHRLHLRRARRGARPGRHPARRRACSSPSRSPRPGSR